MCFGVLIWQLLSLGTSLRLIACVISFQLSAFGSAPENGSSACVRGLKNELLFLRSVKFQQVRPLENNIRIAECQNIATVILISAFKSVLLQKGKNAKVMGLPGRSYSSIKVFLKVSSKVCRRINSREA